MESFKFAHEVMTGIQHAFEAHTLHPKDAEKATRNWDGNTPYIIHPVWCAMTLLSETRLPDEVRRVGYQALLWHDVIEDTKLGLPPDVSPEVKALVDELTFKNFAAERREIWNRSDLAKLLKLYDKTSNLLDASWMTTDQSLKYSDHTAKLAAFVREAYGNLNIVMIAEAICACFNRIEKQS